MPRAKIVCTLGPASSTPERIGELIDAGMSVARLNFSHGSHEGHAKMLQIVRAEGAETRGQRLVRRLRNTATGQEVAGMSTDQIMALLRGE